MKWIKFNWGWKFWLVAEKCGLVCCNFLLLEWIKILSLVRKGYVNLFRFLNQIGDFRSFAFYDSIQVFFSKSTWNWSSYSYAWKRTYVFKACVHYFLRNFYFQPNDSSAKTMKNEKCFLFHLKSSLRLYFCLPLSFSLSAIALDLVLR